MAVQRPDSGYSWVIVLCCAFIHFAMFGLFRSGGVMYVAILQNYDVSREEASWPFALCAAVFQLVGPAVSVITHYISQRKACLLGCAIATVGIAACYFADSVVWIMVFYGVIHGLGFGLVVTLVPVTLNQYFVKHRATAIGIAFSGGTLSSLVFPAVMEWMLEKYSLNESFLLLSGVVMNTLVASCFLRAPPWMEKAKETKVKLLEEGSDAKDSGVSTSDDNPTESKEAAIPPIYKIITDKNSENKRSSLEKDNAITEQSNNVNESLQDLSSSLTVDKSSDNTNSDTLYSNNDSVLFDGSDAKIESDKSHATCDSDFIKNDPEVKKPLMSNDQINIAPKKNKESDEVDTPRSRAFHSISSILKQPMFHLITFTMCIYFLGVHSFFMVIVDFAKDKGIPENKGIYIISVFSITDFFGRACLGWVTDRNYISRKTMVALNLAVLGVLYQIYPLIYSLPVILAVSAINGLAVGSSITLFFVLQAECLGMKRLTLVIGLTSFINGTLSLLRPGIIGLFRDIIGSYNWMFHFVGIISILFSVIWVVESWRTKEQSANRVQDKNACDIKDGC
ncbi:monocarboxylate transporter 9-like [Argiope bruennichi]|uniref:monocarboxylate transporter 9-like n=1 Tax=Argiope bruennichi TaxID=94029 RepID=UPI0024956173|nr:monocarboxylate transporter 9-like [Argiope bruennichi]XP_055937318.1 monocarboxylate transporter 9-like [Argiope bruennichi]XP_055937319.1 monocarboxylate transporter 9-like [Argiope bruennichi]